MADDSESVELYVFGLRSVITEPVTARADLNSTWYEFLNNVCKITVGPEDAVMAATTSYSGPAKRGWCSDLSEKIRSFVDKFSIKKDKYSVRLMMQLTPTNEQPDDEEQEDEHPKRVDSSTESESRQTAGSSSRKRTNGTVTDSTTQSNSTITKKRRSAFAIGSHVYRTGEEVVEEDVEDDYPMDVNVQEALELEESVQFETANENNETVNSEPTATLTPSMTPNERRRSKSRHNDLKPLIKERFKRFDNPFLLRVNDEIRKLQRNQLWDRNVQHSPLGCYFLQELFTE